jgi:hypothetical protein
VRRSPAGPRQPVDTTQLEAAITGLKTELRNLIRLADDLLA